MVAVQMNADFENIGMVPLLLLLDRLRGVQMNADFENIGMPAPKICANLR